MHFLLLSGYVTDVVVDADGRYFVTAENDQRVLMWNFRSRVVLQKEQQMDVVQLIQLEGDLDNIVAISKTKCNKTSSTIYRVIARSELGKRVYKFECCIKVDFPVLLSGDKTFLAIMSYDKAKKKDCVSVYHSKKGVFLHKIILKSVSQ